MNTNKLKSFQEISNANRKSGKYELDVILIRTTFTWANVSSAYKIATYLNNFKLKKKLGNVINACVDYAKFFSNN